MFDFRSTGYNLRNIENTLFVPKPQTNYGKRTFICDRARRWNELPQSVRTIRSLNQIKREIHNLFSLIFRLLHGNLVKQYVQCVINRYKR